VLVSLGDGRVRRAGQDRLAPVVWVQAIPGVR
jgi:hypothetical protein